MNNRSRMIRKAIKHYSSSDARIQALIESIDKYGRSDHHTKDRMKQYLCFKEFATQMAWSCPAICNTKNKNYRTFVEVKI